MLRSSWKLVTEVSGQHFRPILKGKDVKYVCSWTSKTSNYYTISRFYRNTRSVIGTPIQFFSAYCKNAGPVESSWQYYRLV